MDDLVRGVVPEGYKIELFEGRVIMTPRSPEQDWTVSDVRDAAKSAGISRDRILSDVLIKFPGENDAAPDLTIITGGATRSGNSFTCVDVLAVVEIPSEPDDEKDYVRNVHKYSRYGIPSYLIADPFRRVCTLMTEPHANGYGSTEEIPYGEELTLRLVTGETVRVDTGSFPVREDPAGH
ncbi:Uma2 family endonuclease [Streptomyces iconiensis]|uniref:Uma2 family endonuclease n=1 Tax=Streptomyces iconiensis TaxID=1384038 RepID=A0ABT7A9W7_9ACTN|nr:Uma2 family endonuclease [Streptomyces iconiensis]MDJ1138153.1 Uma2 family endonuclease [Streptomyces iconiensis]